MSWLQRLVLAGIGFLAIALPLGGCGSGGGGSLGTGSTQNSSLNVYVTDGFSDQYSQVIVTLYKIEATTDGQTYQTLYSDDSGQTLDLTSLANAAQLLSTVQATNANYTGVRITLGSQIMLTPRGGGASTSVPVDSTDSNVSCGNGECTVTLSTAMPVSSGHLSNLVMDFNLAAFELVGGRIRPSVRPINFSQIAGKMCHSHLTGTVANLNAGVGFDLQERNGGTIHVNLTSTTVVSGDNGQDAALANGANVDVEGTVDTTTSTVTATAVHVRSAANPAPEQNVEGTVATVNAGAGSFTVTVERASHVLPAGGTITVQTDSSTVFHARPGDSVSITGVAIGEEVLVNGTFNSASQTLAARLVLLHPGMH